MQNKETLSYGGKTTLDPSQAASLPRSLSRGEKLTLATGSLSSLCLLPLTAQAGVIQVTGSPVSLALSAATGTIAQWDVDGAGGSDFRLRRSATATIHFASDGSNGRGLIAPSNTDNVQALPVSFSVGPTLANYVWGSGLASSGYAYRNAMQTNTGNPVIGYDFNVGFNPGDNFFGFRFLSAGDLLYGVGVINFDLTNGVVTIDRWAYNDTPDGYVHVEAITGNAVPEPSTASLALLGLGAGGVRAWRSRRKARLAEAA
jgi:hypothetical protein